HRLGESVKFCPVPNNHARARILMAPTDDAQSQSPGSERGGRGAARLYIGTSGWRYPKGAGTWDGTFYPPKVADKDKLSFYAQFFSTVEINSSFYRPPNQYAAKAWATKVPDDFRFTAKLWQKFTHPKMFEEATGKTARVQDEDFDIFAEGIG